MTDELDRLVALVEDSRLWRTVARPLAAAAAAWQTSLIGRAARAWSTQLSSWPYAQRLRLAALAIGVAVAVHASILQVVPPYARPGIPTGWLILDVAVALFVAAFAEAITAAWPGSAMARLTRPITSYWRAGNKAQ